ncbi:inorganic diphosphatase [Caldivirga maquilingensis]|uniref:Inorganic pyrophosphatase n=1 Tax=Caldivirga maquilingensis (strain ATCC 700844 / DSM 13496 / JCM 10307 / IC-167) TaxID=397948 RepID=A8M9I8_CALMQ|nr:inorganic diphosphatase [Caldivirga maquilingensis]ABW00869.1 Inorganic diphosphatase [Caldivirga maquilingensis IC-167]
MVNITNLPPGRNPPDELYVVVEIPAGSNVKYEFDSASGVFIVDRVLYTAMSYPFNYGFIPGTLTEDGDPLDAVVISSASFLPGTIVDVRPVGALNMEDEKGLDYKLITVPLSRVDPRFSMIKDIKDLPDVILYQVRHFFEHYKELEPGKWTKVKEFMGVEEAKRLVLKYIRGKSNLTNSISQVHG